MGAEENRLDEGSCPGACNQEQVRDVEGGGNEETRAQNLDGDLGQTTGQEVEGDLSLSMAQRQHVQVVGDAGEGACAELSFPCSCLQRALQAGSALHAHSSRLLSLQAHVKTWRREVEWIRAREDVLKVFFLSCLLLLITSPGSSADGERAQRAGGASVRLVLPGVRGLGGHRGLGCHGAGGCDESDGGDNEDAGVDVCMAAEKGACAAGKKKCEETGEMVDAEDAGV
eukprot:756600-Hanusia_phi.AAC.3